MSTKPNLPNYNTDTVLDDMTRFIEDNQVFSFYQFARYCRDHNPDWSHVLKHSGSHYIKEYIKRLALKETEETLVSRLDNRIYRSPMTLYTCAKCRLSFVDRNSNYEHCPFCGSKTINKD